MTSPPPIARPPAAPEKRPLSFGQKIILGLFVIGFLLVGFVISEAKIRARHPEWHRYH